MKKPKAPVAGHYIPDEFAEKAIDEVHQLSFDENLDEPDISFCNGFIAALLFLNTEKSNTLHGLGAKEFVAKTLEVDREAREASKSIAEIFKDIDELMESHGFKSAGVGVVM